MRPPNFAFAGVLAVLSWAACASDVVPRKGPCALGEIPDCGAACSDSAPCTAGLFCASGLCSAECTQTSSQRDCGGVDLCDIDGHCLPPVVSQPAVDAGHDGGQTASTDAGTSKGDAGVDAAVATAADAGGGAAAEAGVCAHVSVDASRVTPNIVFIVDQSGSMNEPFGNTTRWEALRSALLDQQGILAQFQNQARFGFALYSARSDDPEPRTCPLLTQVEIAQGNLDAIRAVYDSATPMDDTPTGDAVTAVLASVRAAGVLAADYRDPTVFVLATDGEPDTCAQPDPQNGQAESVAAVGAAFAAGVRTYIVGVANEDQISTGHLTDLAVAGAGMAGAPFYRVSDGDALRTSLRSLVEREVTCKLRLRGQVDAMAACRGTVTLGTKALRCGDANGFALTGPSELTLMGTACDGLKAGETLTAAFPCDAVQ
jgi:Mg-chelatase subunit ChlD